MGNGTSLIEERKIYVSRPFTLQISTIEKLYTFNMDPYETLFDPYIHPPRSEDIHKSVMVHYDCGPHVEELAACLRGEPYNGTEVGYVLATCGYQNVTMIQSIASRAEDKNFVIRCSDGFITARLSTLRRRFQLIDDYFADTGSRSITLGYTTNEVRLAIDLHPWYSLVECYECLLHLNPKSNLYFFHYGMDGATMEQISYLAGRITRAERDALVLSSKRGKKGLLLPDDSTITLLAIFPSFSRPSTLAPLFYASYPSFYFLVQCRKDYRMASHSRTFLTWLLDADFTEDAHTLCHTPGEVIADLMDSIAWILRDTIVTEKELGYLMAMLGVRHLSLGNTETEVLLPYNLLPPIQSREAIVNVTTLLDQFYHIGRRMDPCRALQVVDILR